ncbi:MAG TPA: ribosome maturation factor RimM [Thermoanaerobaculia bacterium]|nr:ribosome maturation factor RimM [Thermoanaerobaculia bacterium]
MSSRSSRTEQRLDLPQTITVGRVLRPHGLRGEVAVEVLSDVPERLAAGSELLLNRANEPAVTVTVVASRPHRAGVLVRFDGIEDRDRAAALRGAWLEVERSRVPAPPAGTYYQYELVGCRCSGAGQELGRVVDLVEDGGGWLLIVSDGQRQLPVPFVQRFLRAVDVAAGTIELELPPGLLETCASRS